MAEFIAIDQSLRGPRGFPGAEGAEATDQLTAGFLADPTSMSGARMRASIEEQTTEAVEGLASGIRLAYKEMTYGASGTEVYPTAFNFPALTFTLVGEGRPVDIEFFIPAIYHSVANGGCFGAIFSQITGGGIVYEQVGRIWSPKTDDGPPLVVQKTKTLDVGVEYTFAFYAGGLTAGTWAGGGSAGTFRTMYAKATAR